MIRSLNRQHEDVIQQNLEPVENLNLLLNTHVKMIGSNNASPRIIFSTEVIDVVSEKRQLHGIIRDAIRNVAVIVMKGQKGHYSHTHTGRKYRRFLFGYGTTCGDHLESERW